MTRNLALIVALTAYGVSGFHAQVALAAAAAIVFLASHYPRKAAHR